MEKAVVFTNKGPGPEVIKDKETGLLCNPHHPEDIAKKIIWMLQNPEKRQVMGQQARLDTLRHFDVEMIVQQNLEFYNKIQRGT